MILMLFEVTIYLYRFCDRNIARLIQVFQDTSSQQAQTERVIAIGVTGGFDFGMLAFDLLFVEELDRVGLLHGSQFFFMATKHEFLVWFYGTGSQACGYYDFAFHAWQ